MLSTSTRPRRRRAPDGLSAAVAPWEWRTFSWAGRRRRSPCCGRHSLFPVIKPSSPTRGSSASAIWPSRPQKWTIGETRNDGRSKRPGWSPKHTSTTRPTAQSPTRQERSRTNNAVTTQRPRASSRPSGGSAHCFGGRRGSTPISRCAARTSASTLATLSAPSTSRRWRTTHYRDIPTAERFPPGGSVLKSGSDEARTTGSPRPSSGSSSFLPTHLSLQEIADRIHLARATVKTHVASIYDKLGVPGRSEAVEMIEQSGVGSPAAKVTIPASHL